MSTIINDNKIIVTKEFKLSDILEKFEIGNLDYFLQEVKSDLHYEVVREIKKDVLEKMTIKSRWLSDTKLEIVEYIGTLVDSAIKDALEPEIQERFEKFMDRDFKHLVQEKLQESFETLIQPTIQEMVTKMVVFNPLELSHFRNTYEEEIDTAGQNGYESGLQQN